MTAEGGHRVSLASRGPLPSRRLSADPPTFDLQSHSLHSDGALEPPGGRGRGPAGRRRAARAERPRHGRRRPEALGRGGRARAAARDRGRDLLGRPRLSRICTCSATWSITTTRCYASGCARWREDREQRADAMGAALRELGYELDDSELERRKAEGKPIGRPHLADAVVRHPGNAERLRTEGLDERSAFLEAYLIDGKPAFKPRTKPTVSESIDAIHDAGGVAVWAHPFWDVEDAAARCSRRSTASADWGLDGVECFYATHTREQAELLADRCAELSGC